MNPFTWWLNHLLLLVPIFWICLIPFIRTLITLLFLHYYLLNHIDRFEPLLFLWWINLLFFLYRLLFCDRPIILYFYKWNFSQKILWVEQMHFLLLMMKVCWGHMINFIINKVKNFLKFFRLPVNLISPLPLNDELSHQAKLVRILHFKQMLKDQNAFSQLTLQRSSLLEQVVNLFRWNLVLSVWGPYLYNVLQHSQKPLSEFFYRIPFLSSSDPHLCLKDRLLFFPFYILI